MKMIPFDMDYLKRKLEEAIHEEIISFSIFSEKEIPSRWNIYNADRLRCYLAEAKRFDIVLFKPKRYEGYLCSTQIAIFDNMHDEYIDFFCCFDEG